MQNDANLCSKSIVLSQIQEVEEYPVVFLSKKFLKVQRNYSTIERELAAIIYGLKKPNHYLDEQKFKIQTDHNLSFFF